MCVCVLAFAVVIYMSVWQENQMCKSVDSAFLPYMASTSL